MHRAPVSVIIPTFNRAALVAEAVASVLAQTCAPAQIVVVDDGSTDDTRERLTPFGERVEYHRQASQGAAAARNRGLRQATNELIAFLDADDCWHPLKIETQLRALHQYPQIGLLGTRVYSHPGPSPTVAAEDAPVISRVSATDLIVKNRLVTSSVIIRHQIAQRVGDFDRALQGPEDHDYWLRAAELTTLANLESPLTGYRDTPGSLSQQPQAMEAGMRRILSKLDARGALRGNGTRRLKAYSYLNYSCAQLYGAAGDPATALLKLVRSLAWYPLPYRRSETGGARLARPRRLAVLAMRCLGLTRSAVGT